MKLQKLVFTITMITAIISISFHNQHDEECHSLHFKLQINWHMFPSHKKTEKIISSFMLMVATESVCDQQGAGFKKNQC